MSVSNKKLFHQSWLTISPEFVLIGPHEMTCDEAIKSGMHVLLCAITYPEVKKSLNINYTGISGLLMSMQKYLSQTRHSYNVNDES